MKSLIALVALVTLVGSVGFVNAAARGGGKGGAIQGTITAVGSAGFEMTVKDKTYDILCDSATQFVEDGQPAKPSVIKVGVKVGVVGGTTGAGKMHAQTVTIMGAGKKGK